MSHATLGPKPAYLAAFILALTLPTASCDPGGTAPNTYMASEPFSYTVDVVDQLRMRLEATNGTITVTGVVGATTMTVEGTKLVWSSSQADAEAGLDVLDAVIDESADSFLVSTDQPDTGTRNYAIEYEIRLPDNLEVSVRNGNGDIVVGFVKANVEVASVNADIRLDEVQGGVLAGLVNGNFDAEVTLPAGAAVEITAGNGDITLQIPTNTSADVFFEIVCCGYDITNLTIPDLEESPPGVFPPTVTGTLGAGQGSITLTVVNGIINMIGV